MKCLGSGQITPLASTTRCRYVNHNPYITPTRRSPKSRWSSVPVSPLMSSIPPMPLWTPWALSGPSSQARRAIPVTHPFQIANLALVLHPVPALRVPSLPSLHRVQEHRSVLEAPLLIAGSLNASSAGRVGDVRCRFLSGSGLGSRVFSID
jgi:hypothetical protein